MSGGRPRILAMGVGLVLALAACGGGADGPATDDGGGTTGGARYGGAGDARDDDDAGDDVGQADPGPGAATVGVARTDLGRILIDPEGRTLYLFMQDAGGESTCYDSCEANWPPLTTSETPEAGAGADGSLLGTTERRDGSAQVTYAGHPLYLYAGDQGPGDTNGQDIGTVWFAVSPDGEAVRG